MTTFHLTVVTPDGCAFEGQAERIVCRAIDGDIAILARHGDYCTALGMGEAHIVDADGQRRRPAEHGDHPYAVRSQAHTEQERVPGWRWFSDIPSPRRKNPTRHACFSAAPEGPAAFHGPRASPHNPPRTSWRPICANPHALNDAVMP